MAHAKDPSRPREELDGTTIVAASRGEPWAARHLVECTQRTVHRYAWRMLGPRATRATTADLVQDVYARVFRALPRYRIDGPARFTTWLLTIAHRTAIDELRRKRPPLTSLNELQPGHPGDRPDHLQERAELGERIAAEVQKLTPALRSAFILRAYHDRNLAEIAEALEIDEGTVKSRLHRARRSLQSALKEVRHEA
ncbi:MAG: sigma-70 family RNA polymerase sigma factor [Nannocystaceae bacterium]|nr:sigma-70 family RNA polymerase sigma factor [Nannocystaceae bacterium]